VKKSNNNVSLKKV